MFRFRFLFSIIQFSYSISSFIVHVDVLSWFISFFILMFLFFLIFVFFILHFHCREAAPRGQRPLPSLQARVLQGGLGVSWSERALRATKLQHLALVSWADLAGPEVGHWTYMIVCIHTQVLVNRNDIADGFFGKSCRRASMQWKYCRTASVQWRSCRRASTQCRFCRIASLLAIFDHMFWLRFPCVVRNARERGIRRQLTS